MWKEEGMKASKVFLGFTLCVLVLGLLAAEICTAADEDSRSPFLKVFTRDRSAISGRGDRIIASDYPTLNDAIDAARELGVHDIYIPSGKYRIDKTLDLTWGGWETGRSRGFRIQG